MTGTYSVTHGVAKALPMGFLYAVSLIFSVISVALSQDRVAYFNQTANSSIVLQQSTLVFNHSTFKRSFSFKTCSNGQLMYQRGAGGDYFSVILINGTLDIRWKSGTTNSSIGVGSDLNSNQWFILDIYTQLGNTTLDIRKGAIVQSSLLIANSTYRNSLWRIDLSGNSGLKLGRDFTGCFLQGPGINFENNNNLESVNVTWHQDTCPPLEGVVCNTDDNVKRFCWSFPCQNDGTCIDGIDTYTCVCPHPFTGTNCGTDLGANGCTADLCLNGGTCSDQSSGDSSYRCSCKPGYTGQYCQNNIDECGLGPCQNGGQCIDGVNSYTCNCTSTGFRGQNCTDDIDECSELQNTCHNGGTCFNNHGSWSCQCPAGFNGNYCEDLDECSSGPCKNGGNCTDGIGNYTCTCKSGFTGPQCDTDIDECALNNVNCPGQNTECRDRINTYNCGCKDGYTLLASPPNCEDINECSSNPCQNSATCVNLENKYECRCVTGYNGTNCENNINDCAAHPCQNGATCEDGVNSFTCHCVAGYTDTTCSTNIQECVTMNQPCKNGATCHDEINGYSCTCADGWTGLTCETDIDECSSSPCVHGTCNNYLNYFNCTCEPGYEGTLCDHDIDDCAVNPCQNGGTCVDKINGYECVCAPDWMGKNCTQVYDACSFHPCQNGANCTTPPLPSRTYSCSCMPGYTDFNCSTDINECESNPCQSPFVCFDLVNRYECACERGYIGVNCSEEIKECESNPCKNGATCNDLIGNYSCSCPQNFLNLTKYGNGQKMEYITGYDGRDCESDIDECQLTPPVCLNDGSCVNTNGSYYCKCGPNGEGIYFTGNNCELKTSYCESAEDVKNDLPACRNNGTCISGPGTYTCICAPGFTGGRCKVEIDECDVDPPPCKYNGTCTDLIAAFSCECIPGITGPTCEIDIDECASDPCQNNGLCIDHINGYECNCTDTGFNGTNCQLNIDDCASQPCMNGGTCEDGIKEYFCHCYEGYTGSNCETDIDECLSSPCQYNGTCLERSKQETYQIIPSLGDFSFANAAGYNCLCISGITGSNCEINIDDCVNNTCEHGSTCQDLIDAYKCDCAPGYRGDKCQTEIDECAEYTPCQNDALCTDRVANYTCTCLETENSLNQLFGGYNCSVELTACKNNTQCQNGARCRPYLVTEIPKVHDFTCICKPGYTGTYCDTPTTGSFTTENSSIQTRLDRKINNIISFQFRTTLPDALMLTWIGNYQSTTTFVTVELVDGQVEMKYISGQSQSEASVKYAKIPVTVNDGAWHEVKLEQFDKLTFQLNSGLCDQISESCNQSVDYFTGSPELTLYFGDPRSSFRVSITRSQKEFKGCMQDITVNSKIILPTSTMEHTTAISVASGCPRTDQCVPEPCNSHGQCVDLWDDKMCICDRPYLGNRCEEEYIPATFAVNNTTVSWMSFNISSVKEQLQREVDLSLYIRTREENGLVVFLGNSNSTFVTLELFNGHLASRLMVCSQKHFLHTNKTLLTDGNQYLIGVRLQNEDVQLYLNEQKVANKTVSLSGCPFDGEFLYFGGKVPEPLIQSRSSRRRRETNSVITVDVEDFSNIKGYKGTMQDAQLNENPLVFYDQNTTVLSNITRETGVGLVPGEQTDDMCALDTPCMNNGTCTNEFFNDFSCVCTHGFRGKNCSELDFCHEYSCPDTAECRSLDDGFECISTASFDGLTTIEFTPQLTAGTVISSVSMDIRTIIRNGNFLHISNGGYYVQFRVRGGNMQVISKLGSGGPTEHSVDLYVSDKMWHSVKLMETDNNNNNNMTLMVSGNYGNKSTYFVVENRQMTLNALITGGSPQKITLGFSAEANARLNFKGCIKEPRIGGILLPFYTQSTFVNFTTRAYFEADRTLVNFGCTTGSECTRGLDQCKHGSACVDDYYGYTCNCPTGYEGQWCQTNVNDCSLDSCHNKGKCVDKVNDFYCQCPLGTYGTMCQNVTDNCDPDPCQHSAPCTSTGGSFTCNCPTQYIGQTCDTLASSQCTNTTCKGGGSCITAAGSTPQFTCTCPTGLTGQLCEVTLDYCADLPCENGGNCTSVPGDYVCTCPSGYTGKNCSTEVNECSIAPTPCKNNGTCMDYPNGYICNCSDAWTGTTCTDDVNECQTQPCQHGTCNNQQGSYFCNCTGTGYEGIYDCATDYDECAKEAPCRNNATCTNFDGGYNCSCTTGYTGKNCSVPDCSEVNCNDGNCSVTAEQTWECVCRLHYYGTNCESAGPCASNPCDVNNFYNCTQNIVTDQYTCACKDGWEGQNCTQDIDECVRYKPCQYNSTCDNLPGSYRCNCGPGYTGTNCETDIDECASNPCKFGGQCTDVVNGYTCNCSEGYQGVTCMDDIDECLSSPCVNGAECLNTQGSFDCKCAPGFIGTLCTLKDPDYRKLEPSNNLGVIIGPVVAGVILIIVLGVIIFLMLARSKRATRGTYNPSRQEVMGSRVELGNVMKPPPEERLI